MDSEPILGVVIDELTYRCYVHNRGLAPDISPERWARILPNVPAMEARYQRERAVRPLPARHLELIIGGAA